MRTKFLPFTFMIAHIPGSNALNWELYTPWNNSKGRETFRPVLVPLIHIGIPPSKSKLNWRKIKIYWKSRSTKKLIKKLNYRPLLSKHSIGYISLKQLDIHNTVFTMTLMTYYTQYHKYYYCRIFLEKTYPNSKGATS